MNYTIGKVEFKLIKKDIFIKNVKYYNILEKGSLIANYINSKKECLNIIKQLKKR